MIYKKIERLQLTHPAATDDKYRLGCCDVVGDLLMHGETLLRIYIFDKGGPLVAEGDDEIVEHDLDLTLRSVHQDTVDFDLPGCSSQHL